MKQADTTARNERMAEMFRQGVILEKIGAQFGITRERVRQVLAAQGVTGQDGGKAVQVAMAGGTATARKRAEARRATEKKWGVDYDLLLVLRAEGFTRAYSNQRKTAHTRGIKFDLTFGQWWAIWQASGHAHERGRGIGKYCMSRMSDAGGYTLGNVHIQPVVENSREGFVKAQRRPPKQHPGVFLIYPGRARAFLAKVGKVAVGYYESAELASAARVEYAARHGITLGGSVRLGRGRGWTLIKKCKARPYFMQGPGNARSYHATQEEAEAAYQAACAAHLSTLEAA